MRSNNDSESPLFEILFIFCTKYYLYSALSSREAARWCSRARQLTEEVYTLCIWKAYRTHRNNLQYTNTELLIHIQWYTNCLGSWNTHIHLLQRSYIWGNFRQNGHWTLVSTPSWWKASCVSISGFLMHYREVHCQSLTSFWQTRILVNLLWINVKWFFNAYYTDLR